MTTVIEALEQYRRALLRNDRAAMKRLIDNYGLLYQRLEDKIELLLIELAEKGITPGRMIRLERYRDLIQQTAIEFEKYGALTNAMLEEQAALGIRYGELHARNVLSIGLTGGTGVAARFNVLPDGAIRAMLGFLQPDGALYNNLKRYSGDHLQFVIDALNESVALGYNPIKTARIIKNAYGRGLVDSMRMTRTAQLWAYREANRASYAANDTKEWIWFAQLTPGVCAGCVSMHGTRHPMSERLNDHHNGRCTMLPVVDWLPPALEEGAGEKWFRALPESEQRKLLGKGKYEAWRNGDFQFSRLSRLQDDPVYGQMRSETPLKDLVSGR